MAQRSPYNDRYKTDQKGKTRRSASAAKPKRATADLTPGESKKPEKKTSAWSRAKTASGSSSKSSSKSSSDSKSLLRQVESAPHMKELRRIWWWLWGGAVVMAVGLWLLQEAARNASVAATTAASAVLTATTATVEAAASAAESPYGPFLLIGWALWLALMAGAFYLEFVPIRKERARVMEAARGGSKSSKSATSAKPGKAGKAAEADGAESAAKVKPKGRLKAKAADQSPEGDDTKSKDAE